MKLRPYQQEAVNATVKFIRDGNPGHPLIVAPTGCHAPGTLILMYDGEVKPVEEIKHGDLLMGPDSQPRTVLQLFQGNEPMYRITPKKGDAFIVNEGHILSLQTTNEGTTKSTCWPSLMTGKEIDNISVSDYLNKSKSWKHLRKLRRVAVDFPPIQRPDFSPWALGALLGDGSILRMIAFTSPDHDVVDALSAEMTRLGMGITTSAKRNNQAFNTTYTDPLANRSKPNRIAVLLKELGVFGCKADSKFIPHCYKTGSRQDRLDILAGLLDTDGHLSRAGFDFISKSPQLAHDVVFVARSVGLSAVVSSCQKSCQNGFSGEYWRVSISGDTDMIPNRCLRKKAPPRQQKKNPLVTGFSVEPVGNGDFYGFALDADHLYLTADFTVHHNSGKSLLIAETIRQLVDERLARRVIVLAHVKELISQNLDKLVRIWPEARVGVYSAGLGRSDVYRQVLFCGIQTVHNKARKLANSNYPIDAIFIDEAHRVPHAENGTYRRFLNDLSAMNPAMKIIGLTATPFRYIPATKTHTGGYQGLTVGDDRIFTDEVFDLSKQIVPLIQDDYLAALWPTPTNYQVDLKGIRIENGDYKADQLNDLMGSDEIINNILDVAIPLAEGDGRKHWMVFCTGVDAANATAANLRQRGISAFAVTGETPDAERDRATRDFNAGQLTALVSVNTLTTGFDAPLTDCLIIARPTLSPVMHVQLMGRGMRVTAEKIAAENGVKKGCLVLDFVGNVDQHGPIDRLVLKGPKPKKEEPVKECPKCKSIIRIFASVCPNCGYEFPKLDQEPIEPPTASNLAIIAGISDIAPPTRHQITRVAYSKHTSGKSGIPTLRADYFDGFFRMASEWICLDHPIGTYPRKKAETWWRTRQPRADVGVMLPSGTDQAMTWINGGFSLKHPTHITLRRAAEKGGYPEIVRYEWDEADAPRQAVQQHPVEARHAAASI